MNVETLLKGGTAIHHWGVEQVSIGIGGGRIVGLYAPDSEPSADVVIDVSGRVLIPGMVDMHSHHRQGTEPGFEYKEDIESVTRACAAGGVTTTVAMPNIVPPPNSAERLDSLLELYREHAVVDYNVNPAGTLVQEIPHLANRGVPALKVFMVVDTGRDYPHMPGIGVHDHGELMAIMEACVDADIPLMVHPHDQSLMDHIERQFWKRGERDAAAYARAYASHDGVVWETAIGTLIRMQKATGVRLHLLHIQTSGSVDMIRSAKHAGQAITAEINPWALFLGNDWTNIEKWGSYALSYWVPEKNTEALWQGLCDGTIDIVATDHAPHTREEKEIGWKDGWKAHTGTPSTQFVLPLLLTAASEGLVPLERVVGATSTSPAELFQLTSKGRLAVGYDADIVVFDTHVSHEITDEEVLSKIGWSPYLGRSVSAMPELTFVRGQTVYERGNVVGRPGSGQMAIARGLGHLK